MSEYDLRGYGVMQSDAVRVGAYLAALRALVRPGAVVLDLGTGAGIMAIAAARLGAARVVAVDTTPVIEMARQNAEASGLADRIEFVRCDSRALELPGGADLIVADLRGALPLLGDNLAVLADARRRLLAPGGAMIPLSDEIWCAPVHAPEEYDRLTLPWRHPGMDLSPAEREVLEQWGRAHCSMAGLLCPPALLARVEHTGEEAPRVRGTARWEVGEGGVAHGVAAWFRTELAPGIGYATGPLDPSTVYGQAFFPWPRPLRLEPGDRVALELSAHLPGSELVLVRRTTVLREGTPPVHFQQPEALFPLHSAAKLERRAAGHRPGLGERGRAALLTLQGGEGGATLGEIADRLAAAFPGQFARPVDAQTFAAEVLERYGA